MGMVNTSHHTAVIMKESWQARVEEMPKEVLNMISAMAINRGDGAATDVAQAVAVGGNGVHALRRGDVGQKAVVEHAGGVETDSAHDIADEHHAPVSCEGQRSGCTHADDDEGREQLFLVSAVVAQRTEERRQNGTDERSDAGGIAPPGAFDDTIRSDLCVEAGEDDGGDDGGKGGVCPVVHDPAAFGTGKLLQHRTHPFDTLM